MNESLERVTDIQVRTTTKKILTEFNVPQTNLNMENCDLLVRESFRELLKLVLYGDN